MPSSFKSIHLSGGKYSYEIQLKKTLRDRLYLYMLSSRMSGLERVKLIKKFDAIKTKDFNIVWAKLPGNFVVSLLKNR